MPLDPSIFLQGAALRIQNNKQLADSIQGGVDNAIKFKTLDAEKAKSGLDLDKLFTPVAIKMSMGQQLSPEEMGIAKAYDMVNTAKLAQDASGNYRRVNASIFGGNQLPSTQPLPAVSGGEGNLPGQPVQGDVVAELSKMPGGNAGLDPSMLTGVNTGLLTGSAPPPPIPNGSMLSNDSIPSVETNGMRENPEQRALRLFPDNPNARQKYLESSAGKKGEADITEDDTVRGKLEFDAALKDLAAENENLKDQGGTPSSGRSVGSNVKSYLGSTDIGQEIGKATASPVQTTRQSMNTLRGGLARKVMAATGMSAKQMDSNTELKTFMDTLGDPMAPYEARKKAYKDLSKLYGNDVFKQEDAPVNYKNRYGLD